MQQNATVFTFAGGATWRTTELDSWSLTEKGSVQGGLLGKKHMIISFDGCRYKAVLNDISKASTDENKQTSYNIQFTGDPDIRPDQFCCDGRQLPDCRTQQPCAVPECLRSNRAYAR